MESKQNFESAPQLEKKIASLEEELAFLRSHVAERQSANPEVPVEQHVSDLVAQIPQHKDRIYEKDFVHAPERSEEIVLQLRPEQHDETVAGLSELIRTQGVVNAIEIVNRLQDMHVSDDFHRFLVEYVREGYPLYKKETEETLRPLRRLLYEVLIPKRGHEDAEPLEHVRKMQTLLVGIQSFAEFSDEHLTIEITNPVDERHFSVYVSVHEKLRDLLEKQMLSLFPSMRLAAQKDDFNVFVPLGAHHIYSAQLSEVAAKCLRTADDFASDPLDVLLGVFTKLEESQDAACVQFVIRPGKGFYSKKYAKALPAVEKGESPDELFARDTTIDRVINGANKFFGAIADVAGAFNDSKKPETDKDEKKVDHYLVDNIKKKIQHQIYSTNIRLIASSSSDMRAKAIANEIKSSFDQFSDPTGNSIVWKQHERDYKKALKRFVYRQFDMSEELPLNVAELAAMVHFPNENTESASQLRRLSMVSAPAPLAVENNGGILLGTNAHAGSETEVRMQPADRLRHMYVIGQTGTGKTSLLKNMIIQDIRNGEGVCMIDPHGSDIQEILASIPAERIDDVIYFDPSHTERPMGLNMLEYDPRFPEHKTLVVNEMMSIFNKLFDMKTAGGPMFEQYFRNATMLVIDDPGTGNTLLDVSRVLSDPVFRALKISRCKNPTVVQFWTEIASKAGGEASLANIVPYITSKFDVFLSNDIMRPVISQSKSSFDFRKIMDEKKILLVNLSKGRLGDINANLIGLILVGKILMAALSRVDSLGQDLPPFYLYIDEFQNITTDSIASILSEARKYRLSLCIAHQFIAQLQESIRDAVFGNVGSMAVFRVGAEDAKFLETQFEPRFTQKDLMGVDNFNFYLKMLSGGIPVDPFNVQLEPPQKFDTEVVEKIKQLSYLKYGKDREEVERAIRESFGPKGQKVGETIANKVE